MALYLIMLRSGSFKAKELEQLNSLCSSVKDLTDSVTLVECARTSREISEAIFPRNDDGNTNRPHIVFGLSSWWGFYDTTVWDWLKTHRSKSSGVSVEIKRIW